MPLMVAYSPPNWQVVMVTVAPVEPLAVAEPKELV
jgi:hypothetical protein